MSEISGTYRDGQVKLDGSVDWPNGVRVRVVPEKPLDRPPETNGSPEEALWGMDERDYQDTPEFRAKLLAQMDSFEPLELSPAEVAEWQAARKWIKDHTIAAVRKQMGL